MPDLDALPEDPLADYERRMMDHTVPKERITLPEDPGDYLQVDVDLNVLPDNPTTIDLDNEAEFENFSACKNHRAWEK